MHGIIIANAYKIPCVRLIIEGKPLGKTEERDLFKFGDYVSGLNANKQNLEAKDFTLNNIKVLPDAMIENEFVTNVREKATVPQFSIDMTDLVNAFPFLVDKYKNKNFVII